MIGSTSSTLRAKLHILRTKLQNYVCVRERKRDECVRSNVSDASRLPFIKFVPRVKQKLSGSCRGEFVCPESFLTSCVHTRFD